MMTRTVSRPSRLNRSRRSRTLNRRKGMTLVEIMIVVVIMALIATAVGVAVLPALGGAKEDIAQQNVAAIKQAAIAYILDGGSGCPTVEDLIDDRKLDEDTDPSDPWGGEYEVVCDGDNVVVTSAGDDEQFETEDDVTTRRRRD